MINTPVWFRHGRLTDGADSYLSVSLFTHQVDCRRAQQPICSASATARGCFRSTATQVFKRWWWCDVNETWLTSAQVYHFIDGRTSLWLFTPLGWTRPVAFLRGEGHGGHDPQNLGLPPGCPHFSYTRPITYHILRGYSCSVKVV